LNPDSTYKIEIQSSETWKIIFFKMFSFAVYFSSLISYYMQSWSFVFFHFTNKVKSWYIKIFKFNWLNTRLLDLKFEIFWDSTEEVTFWKMLDLSTTSWYRDSQPGVCEQLKGVYKTSDFTNNFQSGCTWLPKSWELLACSILIGLCHFVVGD
jgi:hypothetical protein